MGSWTPSPRRFAKVCSERRQRPSAAYQKFSGERLLSISFQAQA